MEHKSLLQSNELYQYLLNTSVYPREAQILKELRHAADQHPLAIMGTSPDAGQLLEMLLSLTNAKKTIEIGVFTGYSLLLTALSLPEDGKITAIDINRKPYEEIGLPFIRKAGVEHKVDYIESPALHVLDKLLEDPKNEGAFDFAFVDADKEGYKDYHERLMKLVKVGGVIAYDNTLWFGNVAIADESLIPEMWKSSTRFVVELNKDLAADSRIQLSHVPVSDGVTICKRLG